MFNFSQNISLLFIRTADISVFSCVYVVQGRLIIVEIELGGNNCCLVNRYCPNNDDTDYLVDLQEA